MAALSAGSVTYAITHKYTLNNSKKYVQASLTLAAGQTYPSGGIPLTPAQLGCPNIIDMMHLSDSGTSGYVFNLNSVTNKLQMYVTTNGSNNAQLVEVASSVTPGAISLLIEAVGW